MASSSTSQAALQQPRLPASQAQRSKEAQAAFLASLKSEGSKIDAELQRRARDIHANAENLTKQDKKVQEGTKQLSKEGDALDKFLSKTEKQLPQTDAFEDEIARLEADLDLIDETLDEVDQGERSSAADALLSGPVDEENINPQAISEPSKKPAQQA
ncbi:hypothetical protein DV738_g1255, partial [Chaetothyriales sp. CBS 135597]